MAEWRDILNRAADNLSVDHASFRTQPAGWPARARGTRDAPFGAGPGPLTRELQVASGTLQRQYQAPAREQSTRHRASLTQTVFEPVLDEQPRARAKGRSKAPAAKKSGAGREILVLSVSVGIVAFAVYGIFALLH